MSPQVNNLITGDIVRQFMEGNVVMVLVTSAFQQTIQKEKPNMKYVMTLPPSGNKNKECVTAIGGEVLVVTPGEKQDEAMEFVKFVSEKCQMEKLLEQIGYLAPREDILQEQIAENEDFKEYLANYATSPAERIFSGLAICICCVDRCNGRRDRRRDTTIGDYIKSSRKIKEKQGGKMMKKSKASEAEYLWI